MLSDEIFSLDRKLAFDHRRLQKQGVFNEAVVSSLNQFLEEYVKFNKLSAWDVVEMHQRFVTQYSEDLKEFKSSGKFPYEMGRDNTWDRVEYDVSLILSTMISKPRYVMMEKLAHVASYLKGQVAVIGIGSGLDLSIIRNYMPENVSLEAYDIVLSDFAKEYFSSNNIQIYESKFNGDDEALDAVFAIELLEHLNDPLSLCHECSNALKSGGKFVLTTATDLPQFDHLYNFNDEQRFENQLSELGFEILEKEDLPHFYFGGPKTSKNTWYVTQKL